MPSVVTGNGGVAAAFRVSTDYDYHPTLGYVVREVWEGPRAPILSLVSGWAAAGFHTTFINRGPRYSATVEFGTDPSLSEVPVDTYSIDKETVQIPIWSSKVIAAELDHWETTPGFSGAQAKLDIQNSVTNPASSPLPSYLSARTAALLARRTLMRGQESFPTKRVVLARNRTFSVAYTGRDVVGVPDTLYTTAALNHYFAIPLVIQGILPATPSSDGAGLTWAWWLRTDRSEVIPYLSKIQETKEWVFAEWDSDFYTVVTYP